MSERKFAFFDDFSFCDENGMPYNWVIEKNSLAHASNASVIDGAYSILLAGNKHFANTPCHQAGYNTPPIGTHSAPVIGTYNAPPAGTYSAPVSRQA